MSTQSVPAWVTLMAWPSNVRIMTLGCWSMSAQIHVRTEAVSAPNLPFVLECHRCHPKKWGLSFKSDRLDHCSRMVWNSPVGHVIKCVTVYIYMWFGVAIFSHIYIYIYNIYTINSLLFSTWNLVVKNKIAKWNGMQIFVFLKTWFSLLKHQFYFTKEFKSLSVYYGNHYGKCINECKLAYIRHGSCDVMSSKRA